MDTRRYVVSRGDVQIGNVAVNPELVLPFGKMFTAKYKVNCYTPSRNMLFINADSYALDLLYDSSLYPIEGLVENSELEKSSIVISEPYSLEKILSIMGYPDDLTYKDLVRIKKEIFSGYFYNEHKALFQIGGPFYGDNSYYIINRFSSYDENEFSLRAGKVFKPQKSETEISPVKKIKFYK